jgi:2-methylisocitrate lyase-like PEP mutase family enzyme
MEKMTTKLRKLVNSGKFIYAPAAFDALGGRLIKKHGFEVAYCGGYTSGSSLCIAEPLLTRNEQIEFAKSVGKNLDIPVVIDAGAGWGEPLHNMRTVRECIQSGIAGAHFEDQLYPKRAHYHKYVAWAIPEEDFYAKIKMVCLERDKLDKDFVVIARTDICRSEGYDKAVTRINKSKDLGADLGLLFPRTPEEAIKAPKDCKLPLVYVQSRGNRDGRPLYSNKQLEDMGYKMCIDAQILLMVSYHYCDLALKEIKETSNYDQIKNEIFVKRRKEIEDIIGLEEMYKIEEETVENK